MLLYNDADINNVANVDCSDVTLAMMMDQNEALAIFNNDDVKNKSLAISNNATVSNDNDI